MSLLSALVSHDKPASGSHYTDRMVHLTGACFQCGIYQERDGRRLPLVRGGEVVAPRNAPAERYELIVPPSALRKVLTMAREFAHALNVPSVQVRQEGSSVWVIVPVERANHIAYEEAWALAPNIPLGHVLLGVNDEGQQLTLDLAGAPHCAVIGKSGSGKSTLLRTMVRSCQDQDGLEVALFDPRSELAPLSGLGHVWQQGYFERDAEIEQCLCYLAGETRHNGRGLLFVFVDEAPRLCHRPRLHDALVTIANEGRHVGMHLVLGAQSVTALGDIVQNAVTIVGQMHDAQHAAQASGQRGTGAERITEPGRFIVTKGERAVHLHAAMMTRQLIDKLTWEFPPRHGVVPSTPEPDMPAIVPHQAAGLSVTVYSEPPSDIGRAPDELPAAVRSLMVRYYVRHGRPPTRRQVSEWVGVEGGLDNDKWHRWEAEALGVHA